MGLKREVLWQGRIGDQFEYRIVGVTWQDGTPELRYEVQGKDAMGDHTWKYLDDTGTIKKVTAEAAFSLAVRCQHCYAQMDSEQRRHPAACDRCDKRLCDDCAMGTKEGSMVCPGCFEEDEDA